MSHKHFTLIERIKLEGFLDENIPITVCAKKLNKILLQSMQKSNGIDELNQKLINYL